MTTARRSCLLRQAVAALLVAVLMIAVGVLPPTPTAAAATLMISGDSPLANATGIDAVREEMRLFREDFRAASSEAREFLKIAGGWIGGVATMLFVDSGRVRKAVARRLSQESKP